jgi:hypothetical protein
MNSQHVSPRLPVCLLICLPLFATACDSADKIAIANHTDTPVIVTYGPREPGYGGVTTRPGQSYRTASLNPNPGQRPLTVQAF